MSDDELVEKMARAAFAALNEARGAPYVWDDNDPALVHDWGLIARAALAAARPVIRAQALEEAARFCEVRYMGDNNREDMEARRCAAAIRALIPSGKDRPEDRPNGMKYPERDYF